MKLLVTGMVLALWGAAAAASPAHVGHGRFKDLAVYSPVKPATSFVLLLSGEQGWNSTADALAERLAQQGAMVAGIDLPKFQAALEADGADCVYPGGDLENLSHFVQAYAHNSTYLAPLLIGIGSGGSFAYAVLAQAPKDTFAGALSLGFCPRIATTKPLCKGSGLELGHSRGSGLELKPIKSLANPWVTLQATASRGESCPIAATQDFVSQVHGAAIAVMPEVSASSVAAAFSILSTSRRNPGLAPPPAVLGDLPVVEAPAQASAVPSDYFAIMMSGDGGWAGIDQDIAAALNAQGIPVVGLDSLRYYWSPRTPEGLAADTDRMIRYYLAHFGKKRVLLIGYSQGADVLPFAVNRLPPATRDSVALAAILGMSEHALFEFHVANWISDDNSGPATLPEVNRISGVPVLCIYGEDERDSLCPKLDANKFKVVKVKGGHHFDGNYAGLAAEILSAARR